jgi:hypothetical protein
MSDVKRFNFNARDADGSTPLYVRAADYDALQADAALRTKCAHCPSPATVDVTLGDPINYSLCERCSALEDHVHDECAQQTAALRAVLAEYVKMYPANRQYMRVRYVGSPEHSSVPLEDRARALLGENA